MLHVLSFVLALVQAGDSVPAERAAARAWYRDAKFGMFIHWGVYSQLGQGEWVMQNRSIAVADYEWLAGTFNPQKFDARAWVALAKSAGMKYITITARHHDGFSMFATRRRATTSWTGRRSGAIRCASWRRSAGGRASSSSSITPSSTGIIRTTGRADRQAGILGDWSREIGVSISISWMHSSRSCLRTTDS